MCCVNCADFTASTSLPSDKGLLFAFRPVVYNFFLRPKVRKKKLRPESLGRLFHWARIQPAKVSLHWFLSTQKVDRRLHGLDGRTPPVLVSFRPRASANEIHEVLKRKDCMGVHPVAFYHKHRSAALGRVRRRLFQGRPKVQPFLVLALEAVRHTRARARGQLHVFPGRAHARGAHVIVSQTERLAQRARDRLLQAPTLGLAALGSHFDLSLSYPSLARILTAAGFQKKRMKSDVHTATCAKNTDSGVIIDPLVTHTHTPKKEGSPRAHSKLHVRDVAHDGADDRKKVWPEHFLAKHAAVADGFLDLFQ